MDAEVCSGYRRPGFYWIEPGFKIARSGMGA